MKDLQFLDDLPVGELVFKARLDHVNHALIHVCLERVVVNLRVQEFFLLIALLLCKVFELLGAERLIAFAHQFFATRLPISSLFPSLDCVCFATLLSPKLPCFTLLLQLLSLFGPRRF